MDCIVRCFCLSLVYNASAVCCALIFYRFASIQTLSAPRVQASTANFPQLSAFLSAKIWATCEMQDVLANVNLTVAH